MKKIKILITRKRIIREFAEEMARLQKRADKYYYINKDPKMSDFILNYASEIKDFSKRLGICNEMYQEAYKIYDFTRSGNKDYTPSKEVLEMLRKI